MPQLAPALTAAAAIALARSMVSISTAASFSDIFSSARRRRRSSRDSPSSGMSSTAPLRMNARDDWPKRSWSPTKTGACTCGRSWRLLTKVPCVEPASYRNALAPPCWNCSTACRREDKGCSKTTSLFGVRPSVRWLFPRASIVPTMAPSFSTSKEKHTSGRPPHSGCSYPPPAASADGVRANCSSGSLGSSSCWACRSCWERASGARGATSSPAAQPPSTSASSASTVTAVATAKGVDTETAERS
mmetsp:Transcript_8163/g.20246  ORF Transcript_8163/g.20246 Transcript_8163/m.20246 type:complete len:246 (-) Transcript_8163:313-1050(-)